MDLYCALLPLILDFMLAEGLRNLYNEGFSLFVRVTCNCFDMTLWIFLFCENNKKYYSLSLRICEENIIGVIFMLKYRYAYTYK